MQHEAGSPSIECNCVSGAAPQLICELTAAGAEEALVVRVPVEHREEHDGGAKRGVEVDRHQAEPSGDSGLHESVNAVERRHRSGRVVDGSQSSRDGQHSLGAVTPQRGTLQLTNKSPTEEDLHASDGRTQKLVWLSVIQ